MHPVDPPANITLESCSYPLSSAIQTDLIGLLRTEWTRTDYDWLEAMHGDYGEALAITSVLARLRGEAIATATVHFIRRDPEIAVLGNVLTHRDHRGKRLATRLIDLALAQAKNAGCAVCLLGTAKNPRNVYLQHGFVWHSGVVMRKNFGAAGFEQLYFAGGQPAVVRPANWGDLPGLSFFASEPVPTICLDFPRGLMSTRYTPAARCLSNFPVLWYDTVARGGMLAILAEPDIGRVFGFGSVTRDPGPARQHIGIIEVATHANYESCLPEMLSHLVHGCRDRALRLVHAFVAAGDEIKRRCFRSEAFLETARLDAALRLGDQICDVIQYTKML